MREQWTNTPKIAAEYVVNMTSESDRLNILCGWQAMAQGGDGGQIEPWGPSIRSVVYPDWSDADFSVAIGYVENLSGQV